MSLFHKLNPLTLNDVFRLEISKLMYNVESYISNILIEWIRNNYNNRLSHKGNFVKICTEAGKTPIGNCGPKIWQEVPTDIENHVSVQ